MEINYVKCVIGFFSVIQSGYVISICVRRFFINTI